MEAKDAGKLGYEKAKDKLDAWRQKQRDEAAAKAKVYEANPKLCAKCNKAMSYERRSNEFCSRLCARKAWKKVKEVRQCANCAAILEPSSKGNYNLHCSDCIAKKVHLRTKTKIEDAKFDGTRRKILIRQRGHKCEVCCNTEWMGLIIPIQLDHIDGNPSNNTVGNLRLICPNCHAQTPTYAGRNIGRHIGREKRNERYHITKQLKGRADQAVFDRNEMKRLSDTGMTKEEIAKQMGCGYNTVVTGLRKLSKELEKLNIVR